VNPLGPRRLAPASFLTMLCYLCLPVGTSLPPFDALRCLGKSRATAAAGYASLMSMCSLLYGRFRKMVQK
jgi:hypothetical protein